MEYEILDIQTVALSLSGEESDKQEITIVEVSFSWENGYKNNSRLEIPGKATDDEVLQAVSKRGNELKGQTDSQEKRSLPMKGKL